MQARETRVRGLVAAATAVAALTLVAGCSTTNTADVAPGTSGESATAAITSEPSLSPAPSGGSPTSSPDTTPDPPPPAVTTPGSVSGDLDQAALPVPQALGPGWRYRVDEGSAEDGYLGSGTPAIARAPGEVALALVPFGCPPAAQALPQSREALEVTYRAPTGADGVALALGFADADDASSMFRDYRELLAACGPDSGGTTTVRLLRDDPRVLISRRTEPGQPTWSEVAALMGNRVVLVTADVSYKATPFAAARVLAALVD